MNSDAHKEKKPGMFAFIQLLSLKLPEKPAALIRFTEPEGEGGGGDYTVQRTDLIFRSVGSTSVVQQFSRTHG